MIQAFLLTHLRFWREAASPLDGNGGSRKINRCVLARNIGGRCGFFPLLSRWLAGSVLVGLVSFLTVAARAMEDADIPMDAPQDGLMASRAEIQQSQNWASTVFTGNTGAGQSFLADGIPFSFRYRGVSSSGFLKDWSRTVETNETSSRRVWLVHWQDPASGLSVTANVTAFQRYPAVEWVLEFENTGAQETGLLEAIEPLAAQLQTKSSHTAVRLHQLVGDIGGERSFLPFETEVEPGKDVVLAPAGGRSSNGAFPFFNVQYGDEGMITAIGWSGQWRAELQRSTDGPTTISAGLEKTSLRLRPGEKFRTPRILVLPWKGDRLEAHNRFRRLMLFEHAPRQNGRLVRLPIALQCYDRYVGSCPDWGTIARQLQVAKAGHEAGCDTHWLDAAWFEGGFPNGVGNWFCPKERFPNGLNPLSEACHQMGMKFIVWFEPERVAAGTQIARKHPEFVFGGEKGGLFKLNDPVARRWLTELLSRRIAEFGLDTYRNDFNIDPLSFWRQADAPDRQGLTEIRYVEGLYALWDELRSRHPGLSIDNCASGGRRIDLETCERSVPLWHSDSGCAPGRADWNQTQSYGLNLFVPLFAGCAWTPNAYDVRSAATAGLICQFAVRNTDFSVATARAALAEIKEIQKFWYGDFYPLTPCTLGPQAFMAYQFHRSDLDSGVALAFRRTECPNEVLPVNLRALRPTAIYHVEFIDEARMKTERDLPGKALMKDFELKVPARGASLLVKYKRLEGR